MSQARNRDDLIHILFVFFQSRSASAESPTFQGGSGMKINMFYPF